MFWRRKFEGTTSLVPISGSTGLAMLAARKGANRARIIVKETMLLG
jgi:hypothetical protein